MASPYDQDDEDEDYKDIQSGRVAPEAFIPPRVPTAPAPVAVQAAAPPVDDATIPTADNTAPANPVIRGFDTPGAAAAPTTPAPAPDAAPPVQTFPTVPVAPPAPPAPAATQVPVAQDQQPAQVDPAQYAQPDPSASPAPAPAAPQPSAADMAREYQQFQAGQLKFHKSQGGQTEVLPTGAEVIKTDDAGNALYHPGVVQPFVRGDDGNGYRVTQNQYGTQHYFNLAAGAEGQDYHVDPVSGDKYVTTTGDDGASKREVIGNDPLVPAIGALKNQLQQHTANSEQADVTIAKATDGVQGAGPLRAASLGDLRDEASQIGKDLKPLQQQLTDLNSYAPDGDAAVDPADLSQKKQLQDQIAFKQQRLGLVQSEVDSRDSTIADARQQKDGIAQQRQDAHTQLAVLGQVRAMGGVQAVQGDLSTIAAGGALPADRAAFLTNAGLLSQEQDDDSQGGSVLRVTPIGQTMLPPDARKAIAASPDKFTVTANDAPVPDHVARAAQGLAQLASPSAGDQPGPGNSQDIPAGNHPAATAAPSVQPEGFWATAGRAFASKIAPAVGTAAGGLGAGTLALETGPGAVAADIVGGALAGAATDKLQRKIMGDQWANQNDAQMAANAQAHPVAAQIGTLAPFLVSLLGGGGAAVSSGGKVIGRAITTEGKQAVQEAAAAGAQYMAPTVERVAQAAAGGARAGASEGAQGKYVEGKDVSVLDSAARGAVTMGVTGGFAAPLANTAVGLVPMIKTVLSEALGRGIKDGAAMQLAGDVYDTAVHGKPFDLKKTAEEMGGSIPTFVLQNALLGFFHAMPGRASVPGGGAGGAGGTLSTTAAAAPDGGSPTPVPADPAIKSPTPTQTLNMIDLRLEQIRNTTGTPPDAHASEQADLIAQRAQLMDSLGRGKTPPATDSTPPPAPLPLEGDGTNKIAEPTEGAVPPVAKDETPAATPAAEAASATPAPAPPVAPPEASPEASAQADGSSTNPPSAQDTPEVKLPPELAGAKPRYSYGPKQYQLAFESDLDKAAYTLAQSDPNKRHDDYLSTVQQQTGLSTEQIVAHGEAVRAAIKGMAKDGDPNAGPLVVPKQEVAGFKLRALADNARSGDKTPDASQENTSGSLVDPVGQRKTDEPAPTPDRASSQPAAKESVESSRDDNTARTSGDVHQPLADLVNSGAKTDNADGAPSLPFQVLSRLRDNGVDVNAETSRAVHAHIADIMAGPEEDRQLALKQLLRDAASPGALDEKKGPGSETETANSGPKAAKGETAPGRRGSTQLTLSPEDAKPFQNFARSLPDSVIHSEKDALGKQQYGRELEPHVTSLYGLSGGGDKPGAVADAVDGHGPVKVKVGKLSVFSHPDRPYDVLKADIHGDSLHDLNGKLRTLPHSSDFSDYHPHLTIAYVKKGLGEQIAQAHASAFEGKEISFDKLTHSSADRTKTELPLTHEPISRELAGATARRLISRNMGFFNRVGVHAAEIDPEGGLGDDNRSGLQFANGKVRVDTDKLARTMSRIRDDQRKQGIEGTPEDWLHEALDEEGIHGGQKKVAAKYGMSLSQFYGEKNMPDSALPPGWQDAGRKAYDGWDKLPRWAQVAEFTRMVVQGKWKGRITESLRKHVDEVVEFLKQVVRGAGVDSQFRNHYEEVFKEYEAAKAETDGKGGPPSGGNEAAPGTGQRQPVTEEGQRAQRIISNLTAREGEQNGFLTPGERVGLAAARESLERDLNSQALGPNPQPTSEAGKAAAARVQALTEARDAGAQLSRGEHAEWANHLKTLHSDFNAQRVALDAPPTPAAPAEQVSPAGTSTPLAPSKPITVPPQPGDTNGVKLAREWVGEQRAAGRQPEAWQVQKAARIGIEQAQGVLNDQRQAEAAATAPAAPFKRPSRAVVTEQTRLVRSLEAAANGNPDNSNVAARYQDASKQLAEMQRQRAMPLQPGETPRSFKMPTAPDGNEDVLDHVRNAGGLVSPKDAQAKPTYDPRQGDYDGAPTLGGFYHHAVYKTGGGGIMPDRMAAILHENHGVGDGSIDGMWNAIGKAVDTRQKVGAQMKAHAVLEKQASRFDKDALQQGTAKGKTQVYVENLSPGDKVQIGDQTLTVKGIDPKTMDVELDDHSKYGVQKVAEGTAIYVEKVQAAGGGLGASAPDAKTGSLFGDDEPFDLRGEPASDAERIAAAREQGRRAPAADENTPLPQLRPGEKGTADLFQGEDQPFNLAGETGIDHAARQQDQERQERETAEAQAVQDRAQGSLFASAPDDDARDKTAPIRIVPGAISDAIPRANTLGSDPLSDGGSGHGVSRRQVGEINPSSDANAPLSAFRPR